jgi:hypothetical protein
MSDGSTPIIVFRDGSSTGTEILWTASSNIHLPDVAYDFTPTNNDTIPSHYTNTGTGYSYSYTPPTPPPQPNPMAFVAAMTADVNIQPLLFFFAPFFSIIQSYSVNPDAVKLIWSQLVAQYAPPTGPLSVPLQGLVEGYASANNMPFV